MRAEIPLTRSSRDNYQEDIFEEENIDESIIHLIYIYMMNMSGTYNPVLVYMWVKKRVYWNYTTKDDMLDYSTHIFLTR